MKFEHQYDCKGNHRIVMTTDTGTKLYGDPGGYEHPAFFEDVIHHRWYVALTPCYEGTLPHELITKVFQLSEAGEDSSRAGAYNFHDLDEKCPWLGKPDTENICPLRVCPQKERRQSELQPG